jgi:hypothetical protein
MFASFSLDSRCSDQRSRLTIHPNAKYWTTCHDMAPTGPIPTDRPPAPILRLTETGGARPESVSEAGRRDEADRA